MLLEIEAGAKSVLLTASSILTINNATLYAKAAPTPLIATVSVLLAVPELVVITNTKLPLVIDAGLITLTPAGGVNIMSLVAVNW